MGPSLRFSAPLVYYLLTGLDGAKLVGSSLWVLHCVSLHIGSSIVFLCSIAILLNFD